MSLTVVSEPKLRDLKTKFEGFFGQTFSGGLDLPHVHQLKTHQSRRNESTCLNWRNHHWHGVRTTRGSHQRRFGTCKWRPIYGLSQPIETSDVRRGRARCQQEILLSKKSLGLSSWNRAALYRSFQPLNSSGQSRIRYKLLFQWRHVLVNTSFPWIIMTDPLLGSLVENSRNFDRSSEAVCRTGLDFM